MSIRDFHWIGLGFNDVVAQPMVGSLGVLCKKDNQQLVSHVFNNSGHSYPKFVSLTTAGLPTDTKRLVDGALICEFQVPFAGNSYLHSLDTASPQLIVSAWGQVNDDGTIKYHEGATYYHAKFNVTSLDITDIKTGTKGGGVAIQPAVAVLAVMYLLSQLLIG